jgi:NADPH-dependent 2,4-dienoyl-CoA reductase/sulfur reductase-like enzyme/rhodanese-related sulfurtransferase
MKILIIGGVAAGMSAATRLRRLNEDAEIIVFEMGDNVSYANCGLPYFISDVIENRDELLLQTPEKLHNRFRLDVRVKTKVIAIDTVNKTVTALHLETNEESTESYDKLVITTGATPRKLDIPGAERALTLRDVSDADNVKAAIAKSKAKTAAVLGGGFIGIELAENLRHLGIDVTVIQRSQQILPQFDIEIIEVLQKRLEENGVKLKLNSIAEQITENQVILASGEAIPADIVFSATGVVPDNQLAKSAGLELGPTGGLKVNQHQQTSNPDIFAAGDAVEKLVLLTGAESLIPLANLANRHGRLIADAIAGKTAHAHDSLGTAIIGAFGMAAAMTGLTEAFAKKNNIDYQAIHLHPGSHAGYYPGAKRLSVKVLFDPYNGKLLGAQAIGEDGADKRIDVIATAIYGNLTIDDLMNLELSYAPQFGSAKDPINHAGYLGNNVYSGQTPTLQWYQLEEELKQPNTVLVDVRTSEENQSGSIPNAINIDVNELRENLDQLKGKLVIVHCQVGQRGHIATQILKANGISATNLDGGYITWRSGMDALNRK